MSTAPSHLRIALVSLHTSPLSAPGSGDAGGMNVVVRHQAEALAAFGHDVDVITRRSSPEQADVWEVAPRLRVRHLDAGPARPIAKGEHELYMGEFSRRLAELGHFDVIHSHHWFSGIAALPVARAHGVPLVHSYHSIAAEESTPLSEGERPESPGRLAGEKALAREADALVAISNAEAETIVSRLGGDPARVSVVSPGVDGAVFHPRAAGSRKHASPAEDGGYVVVAGRLQPLKGFDLAIDAIGALEPAERPVLVIAGDTSVDFDGYTEELTARAAALGITDGIRFVGPQSRERLAELFRESLLVLVPSHSETYGLVALEASASGVPVIAAASGGLREAVVDGVTGLVLPDRGPELWASAIRDLLGDQERIEAMGLAALAHARERSWGRSAAELAEVYRAQLNAPVAARTAGDAA